MTEFDEADVAAMRKQGDLKDFIRAQLRVGQARRTEPPAAPEPPPPPGHRPGAWPTGTRPSSALRQHHPPAAWDEALAEYRDWLTATDHPELGHPTGNRQTCGCPTCTPRRTT